MTALFPKSLGKFPASKIDNVTLRGFGGGWDAVSDDISMRPTFCPELINFRRTASGSQKLRFGSKWFVDVAGTVTGNIVDMNYFVSRLIVPTSTGQVATVNDAGAKVKIWDTTIAALLPGAPAGWAAGAPTIDFVPFRNTMILHNGIDKPISISKTFGVTYLQDLATGSNVNVPIGKYGCVVSNFHCVAGIAGLPTTVYISSQGTAGVFPGDAPPNNSISVDVGAYAPEGGTEITGIAGYRTFLIVFFHEQSLVIQLGVFDDAGVHTPVYPDTFPQLGLLGHRCIITQTENELNFASRRGLGNAKRNLISNSGLLDSALLSQRVEPPYKRVFGSLTDTEQLNECFAVYDPLQHDTLIFNPSGRTFVYSANAEGNVNYKAWSEYADLEWSCACASLVGRIFAADGTRIFQHGNGVFAGENYQADRIDDRDGNWSTVTAFAVGTIRRDTVTNESYTCLVSHTSGAGTFLQDRTNNTDRWELYEGIDIDFVMELPWLDSKDPMKVKKCSFAALATKGTAEFTLELYVDNLYKDVDGTVIYDPAVELDFIGNDAAGFGFDAGPFGGGRRSNHPKLQGLPVKFKTLKPRIVGSAKKPLEIVMLSFLFARGRYSR